MTTSAEFTFASGAEPLAEMDVNHSLDDLLNAQFAGKVVRKDLTKLIKEGANVPVYVLEYLLGMYCASNDDATIQNGLVNVKKILTENYVRPDEAEKVKSKVRESGTYKVIDKVTVRLNEKRDVYEALLSNLGVKNAEVSDTYVRQFEKLLVGGIWCIVTLKYHFEEDQRLALHGDRTQADPDAEHGHAGAVQGSRVFHRRTVD